MSRPLRYLSADQVQQCLPMSEAIECARDAFTQIANGSAVLPTRQNIQCNEAGVDLIMPCASRASHVFSLKTVTVFPQNNQVGRPTTQGLLILTDAQTGSHRAIMDGTSLTAIRTGAASGLATDLLAAPDAASVAIIGAGGQARTQLEAVCCVRNIQRATVYSPSGTSAQQFAAEMSDRIGISVQAVESPNACLTGADIICTATSSFKPVISAECVLEGTHINAVGAFRPDMAELPTELVCRSRIFVDHVESAIQEAGDLLQPLQAGLIEASHFSTELGNVVAGTAEGRTDVKQITVFKSVGVAIQDLCAAVQVLENADRKGIGTSL